MCVVKVCVVPEHNTHRIVNTKGSGLSQTDVKYIGDITVILTKTTMVKGKHESVESATPVRVLPLVGRTGTGKSSLDNAVLGKNVFSVGWPSESMTKASQTASNDEMEQKNRTYHEMKRLFGDDISRCMVVVFTRLDSEGEHFGFF